MSAEDGGYDGSAEEVGTGLIGTQPQRMSIQDETALLNEVGEVLRKLRERREVGR